MKKIVWAGLIVLAVIYFSFSLDKAFRYSQKQSLKEMSTNYKEEQFKIISACTKEIEALPTVELYIKRGNAYATLSGFKEFIPKNYAKGAIFDYNQAIAIDPNSFDAYYNRALIFLKEKDSGTRSVDELFSQTTEPSSSIIFFTASPGFTTILT